MLLEALAETDYWRKRTTDRRKHHSEVMWLLGRRKAVCILRFNRLVNAGTMQK